MAIRVLVTDDSAFMRKAISMILEEDPGIEVVGTARDGQEAVEKVRELKPDLLTMDIEMPRMDGIAATREIMANNPLPIIIISSLTAEGAQNTIEAMQAGAVDFITKEMSSISYDLIQMKRQLTEKVKSVIQSHIKNIDVNSEVKRLRERYKPRTPAKPQVTGTLSTRRTLSQSNTTSAKSPGRNPVRRTAQPGLEPFQIVVIGISTGGPFSLQQIVPALPGDLSTPVAIVQHMPPHFTKSLADRLNTMSELNVVEAEDGMEILPGNVYIAPGGQHLKFAKSGTKVLAKVTPDPQDVLFRPSVDVMFDSANTVFGGNSLAVIMTGMGKDGLEGTRKIKNSGGYVIAQNEESCVVYGMPKAIVDAQLADHVLPLNQIAEAIVRSVS